MAETTCEEAKAYAKIMHNSLATPQNKKAENLTAKMKAPCAMLLAQLDCDGAALPKDFGKHTRDEECLGLAAKPFVLAAKAHSWLWDANASPLPGVASFIFPLQGKFFATMIPIEALQDLGCEGITSLDLALGALDAGGLNKLLGSPDLRAAFVHQGTCVFVPYGFVALMTSMPNPLEGDG